MKHYDVSEVVTLICGQIGEYREDGNGEHWCECPYHGCSMKGKNFSFSERGWFCYKNQEGGGILALARHLNLIDGGFEIDFAVTKVKPKPEPPPSWAGFEQKYLERMWADPQLVERWQAYKPLTRETIESYQLGYGRLPFLRDDGSIGFENVFRLIVPQFEPGGTLIGLYGRRMDGVADRKWSAATGSKLRFMFGIDRFQGSRGLIICENRVDAMLLKQDPSNEGIDVLCLQTARKLREDEVDLIASMRPTSVLVMLDNDEHGQAGHELATRLRLEWMQRMAEKNPGVTFRPPEMFGHTINRRLRGVGLAAHCFEWPADAPPKADVGWLYEEGRVMG